VRRQDYQIPGGILRPPHLALLLPAGQGLPCSGFSCLNELMAAVLPLYVPGRLGADRRPNVIMQCSRRIAGIASMPRSTLGSWRPYISPSPYSGVDWYYWF
jgi:hypothetical protein